MRGRNTISYQIILQQPDNFFFIFSLFLTIKNLKVLFISSILMFNFSQWLRIKVCVEDLL
jgi:hypothetical protein